MPEKYHIIVFYSPLSGGALYDSVDRPQVPGGTPASTMAITVESRGDPAQAVPLGAKLRYRGDRRLLCAIGLDLLAVGSQSKAVFDIANPLTVRPPVPGTKSAAETPAPAYICSG